MLEILLLFLKRIFPLYDLLLIRVDVVHLVLVFIDLELILLDFCLEFFDLISDRINLLSDVTIFAFHLTVFGFAFQKVSITFFLLLLIFSPFLSDFFKLERIDHMLEAEYLLIQSKHFEDLLFVVVKGVQIFLAVVVDHRFL